MGAAQVTRIKPGNSYPECQLEWSAGNFLFAGGECVVLFECRYRSPGYDLDQF